MMVVISDPLNPGMWNFEYG